MTKENPKPENQNSASTFYIKIVAGGPYLVYGNPPIDQEIIVPDENGNSWVYIKGKTFKIQGDHCALCRCGKSEKKPFCDGAHKTADWDSTETNDRATFEENAIFYKGPSMIMADNEEYCAFARFCDARGRVWNIVERAVNQKERELAAREVAHCPSGRLVLYNRENGELIEPEFSPGISILEDPGLCISGPIWVKGGIRIESSDGTSYEIRNRVTLCRCGQSRNKPFCDGSHVEIKFQDNLSLPEDGQQW